MMSPSHSPRGASGAPAPGATGPDQARLRLHKFVTFFESGGTERHFANLCVGLDPQRFDLEVGCLKKTGPYLAPLEARQIPVHEYPIQGFFSPTYARMAWRLARHLSRRRAQVVHSYGFYGNVFAVPAARLAGVPVVIASIRDRGVYLTPRQLAMQREVCRLADCVLVNAESVREWLVESGYNPAKILLINNGIDLSSFRRSHASGTQPPVVRRELGIPVDAPLIGIVGRLNEAKGLEQFLQAAAAVHASHNTAWFVIVGDGPDTAYVASLKRRAQELGISARVVFAGQRSDIPRVLHEMSISVLASLSEAMPNAVLESMAAGLPVVATRVGGVPEAIEDGATGLLVPPGDATAITRALQRLLDQPSAAAQMGRAAQVVAHTRFSLDRMVRVTSELYMNLALRKGAVAPDTRQSRDRRDVAFQFSEEKRL
jgi:L-malate glycosyltransferase